MSADYFDKFTDALGDGFDSTDANSIANGLRIHRFACVHCGAPIEEEGACADCQYEQHRDANAED